MERVGPPVQQHAVQLLTPAFQMSGQLEAVGNLVDFVNDNHRDALILHEAQLAPLSPGGPMRGLARPQLSVRKREVILLYLTEADSRAEMRLLAREEPLIVYTPLAVLRGTFHPHAEASMTDFLASTPGDFLPATAARLFFLKDLPSPFPEQCDLVFVGRRYFQLYHAP